MTDTDHDRLARDVGALQTEVAYLAGHCATDESVDEKLDRVRAKLDALVEIVDQLAGRIRTVETNRRT